MRLSFIYLAQIVVLSYIGDSSHVLNLNHLVVHEASAADSLSTLHQV